MNKKFLSAILFGALMVTSTGTFVSCKDYDDDIDGLQTQVDANKADCAAGIQALQGQVAALQSALATAQSTADAAKKAAADAQNAADAAKKAAEAAAAQAKADAIAKAIEEVEALKAWVEGQNYVTNEDLAAALLPVSAKIAAIEETLDQITVYITETLEANIQTALKNIMTLQEDLAIQQAVLEEYEALMEELKAGDEELWAELTSTREELQEAISALNLLLEDATDELWAEIQLVKNELYGAITNLANLQADDKAELMNEINEILKANQTTSDILNALINTQADDKAELKNEIEQILIENAKLSETLAALITIHGEDKAALEAAVAELSKTLEEKIKAFEAKLGDADTTYGEEINKLWNEINLLVNQNVETSNTIASLITLLGDMEDAHAADIAALKGELSKLIADQIAALNTALELQFEEVWAEIAANNSTLGSAITSVQNQILDLQGELATLHILVNTRLASLTFIPNAYVDGVEAIVFRSYSYNALTLTANKKDSKNEVYTAANNATIVNPVVYAQYQVSPSTVGLDQFVDEEGNLKDNLSFTAVKNAEFITSRAAASDDFSVAPEFVSLENGILTVKVNITGVPATDEKISVVALQVKTDDGAVVTSDYATVYKKDYQDLRIVDEQKCHDADNPVDYHFRRYINTVDSEAGINTVVWDDYTDSSIDLEFDYRSTLNLNEVVGVHELTTPHTDTELSPLGMHMEYDVVLNYIIGANQTDQKDFVTLKDGILNARVFDEAGAAAIGRTPIIRARLMHGNNIVKIAYIKVKIVKETTAPQNKVYSLVVDDFKFVCATNGVVKTTIAQINTQLYNKIGLSKDEFHARYTAFDDVVWANENSIVTDLGTVAELTETVDGTTTHLLEWTITEDQMWAHAGEAVTNRIYYRVVPGSNVFVEIELKSNIKDIQKLYDMKKADFIANYWDANKTYTKFNVAVPTSTTDDDANNCTFINNLNAPFTTWPANSTVGIPGIMKLDASITALNYYFCEDVEEIEEIGGVEVTFAVSADGLTLSASEDGINYEPIATIDNAGTGITPNTITYNKSSNLAKKLLNTAEMYTLIGVYGEVCNDDTKKVEITFEGEDHFVANFLRPVNVTEQAADNFIDGVDFNEKGSFIRLEDLIAPYDWRNRDFADHENYWGFYGPFDVEVDVADAECNLNGVRQAVPVTVVLGQVDVPSGQTTVTMGTGADELESAYGFLTYKNNGTNVSAFEIYVKVKVNYGWGTILTDWITVKVDSTVNQ